MSAICSVDCLIGGGESQSRTDGRGGENDRHIVAYLVLFWIWVRIAGFVTGNLSFIHDLNLCSVCDTLSARFLLGSIVVAAVHMGLHVERKENENNIQSHNRMCAHLAAGYIRFIWRLIPTINYKVVVAHLHPPSLRSLSAWLNDN